MSGITNVLKGALARHSAINDPIKSVYRKLWNANNARENRRVDSILDALGEHLVEDPCVKVYEFDAEFYLDPRSALFHRIIRSRVYEPELTALCKKYIDPDRDVLDIGANVGFHAVYFAKLLNDAKVVSVEPTSKALERLKRNIEHNNLLEKVHVHHGAVADSSGHLKIKTIAGREEYSTLGNMAHPSVNGVKWVEEDVETVTLDELVKRHKVDPGFMKVDVEGAEHMVFAQASEVLTKHRPVIITELSDALLKKNGSSSKQVIEMIRKYDYEVTDPLRSGVEPGDEDFGDILCIPR